MSKQVSGECSVCKRDGYMKEKDGNIYCGWCGTTHQKTTKVSPKRPPAKKNKETE